MTSDVPTSQSSSGEIGYSCSACGTPTPSIVNGLCVACHQHEWDSILSDADEPDDIKSRAFRGELTDAEKAEERAAIERARAEKVTLRQVGVVCSIHGYEAVRKPPYCGAERFCLGDVQAVYVIEQASANGGGTDA